MKESKEPVSSAWEALTAGAVDIVDRDHLRGRIERGDRLRVKLGLDPTRPDLHLGHTIPLRVMRRFEDEGHTGVLIVGDWTARIGDPSGQNATRPQLTREQVDAAARTYLEQLWKILDQGRTEVRYQSEWFDGMTLDDVVGLLGQSTVARMLAREDFARRYKEGRPIGLHELLYPLLQGYDSVAVKADLELGGTDQTFNLLVGRDLQQAAGQPPQDILTMPLLEGLDGVQKMSKSLDNYIGIDEPPEVMRRKILSIPDTLIGRYFQFLTASPTDVDEALSQGVNPVELKEQLADAIISQFHPGTDRASYRDFKTRFVLQAAELKTVDGGPRSVAKLFVEVGLASSKSEVRRLVAQRGLRLQPTPKPERFVEDADAIVEPQTDWVLYRGSHRSARLIVR